VYATDLWQDECAGCHDGSRPAGGLDLGTEGEAYTILTTGSGETGTSFVVSGDASASYLYRKMAGTAADGDRMPPPGEDPTTLSQLALVEAWINEGSNP
jgi:hypothetical protein